MSNVLIGIIGVILFIGLALAGALFLGPRFQEATTNSDASAVMAGIHQVAMAAEMLRVQEGVSTLTIANDSALTSGYLKNRPNNTTPVARRAASGEAFRYSIHLNNDICPDNIPEAATTSLTYVMTPVGYGEGDDKICRAIARSTTGTMKDFSADEKTGCVRLPESCGLLQGTSYIAYERL